MTAPFTECHEDRKQLVSLRELQGTRPLHSRFGQGSMQGQRKGGEWWWGTPQVIEEYMAMAAARGGEVMLNAQGANALTAI